MCMGGSSSTSYSCHEYSVSICWDYFGDDPHCGLSLQGSSTSQFIQSSGTDCLNFCQNELMHQIWDFFNTKILTPTMAQYYDGIEKVTCIQNFIHLVSLWSYYISNTAISAMSHKSHHDVKFLKNIYISIDFWDGNNKSSLSTLWHGLKENGP